MASGVLRLEKTETTNARLFSVRQPEDTKDKDNGDQEMETGEEQEGGHSGGQTDLVMDIDSKDDEWLLEAAKQFQCASEDQGAVQDKYKVRFILLHSRGNLGYDWNCLINSFFWQSHNLSRLILKSCVCCN